MITLILLLLVVISVTVVFWPRKNPRIIDWQQECVLITGGKRWQLLFSLSSLGSGGIGYSLAQRLARLGAKVIIWDICRLSETDGLHYFCCNVSLPDQVDEAAALLITKNLIPTILVNNAGVVTDSRPCWESDPLDVQKVINTKLLSAFWTLRAFMPLFIRSKKSAHIVNVASGLGLSGSSFMGPYCASKFGLKGLDECLRLELKHLGLWPRIRTTVICPLKVDTSMFASVQQGLPWLFPIIPTDELVEKIIQVLTWGGPEEVLLPRILNLFPLARILPTFLFDTIHRLMGDGQYFINKKTL